ncbi:MAG: HD domain-containing protein [Aerococcus sp.]|nr:HD domain-containing protein [Aerococcus sp.]
METPKLYDMPLGEEFEIFVLIKNASVKTDRNGRQFIAFSFQDRSGAIDGMYWSAADDEVERFQPGRIVSLRGYRELYHGQPQVHITGLRLTRPGEPEEIKDYTPAGPISAAEMAEAINHYVQQIKQPVIHDLVTALLEEMTPDFYDYPAAKRFHHAFVGGLAFHTLSILQLAEQVVTQYGGVNQSLLYGGIILHDMAKTIEFSNPVTADYTVEGNLLGHISLMAGKIALTAEKLGYRQEDEAVVLLKHLILAHHGKQEYGSPVSPQLMEAEILHHLDDLDATMNMMQSALDQTKPNHFSQRIMAMDGRTLYQPSRLFQHQSGFGENE